MRSIRRRAVWELRRGCCWTWWQTWLRTLLSSLARRSENQLKSNPPSTLFLGETALTSIIHSGWSPRRRMSWGLKTLSGNVSRRRMRTGRRCWPTREQIPRVSPWMARMKRKRRRGRPRSRQRSDPPRAATPRTPLMRRRRKEEEKSQKGWKWRKSLNYLAAPGKKDQFFIPSSGKSPSLIQTCCVALLWNVAWSPFVELSSVIKRLCKEYIFEEKTFFVTTGNICAINYTSE